MKPALLAAGLVAALAVSTSGCVHGDDEAPPHQRLDALGFLDYADPSRRELLGRDLRRDPAAVVFDEGTNRFFFADAESLAEGGVGALLAELEPF